MMAELKLLWSSQFLVAATQNDLANLALILLNGVRDWRPQHRASRDSVNIVVLLLARKFYKSSNWNFGLARALEFMRETTAVVDSTTRFFDYRPAGSGD